MTLKVFTHCKPFCIGFFSYSCAAVEKILIDVASRGPSATAKTLVRFGIIGV